MLKRPMETGHVDVAADATRRVAPRRIANHENISPLSRATAAQSFFFHLSTVNRNAPRNFNRDICRQRYPNPNVRWIKVSPLTHRAMSCIHRAVQ